MKHLFVPYELAKLAKEKRFDEECLGEWQTLNTGNNLTINEEDRIYDVHILKAEIRAPLYQQLVDWFFDKHKILIEPLFDANGMWCIWITNDITKTHRASGNFLTFDDKHCLTNEFHGWKDKHEALTKALEEAFKLI